MELTNHKYPLAQCCQWGDWVEEVMNKAANIYTYFSHITNNFKEIKPGV